MQTKTTKKIHPNSWELIPVSEVFSFLRTHAFSRDNLITELLDTEKIGNIHYGDIHSTYTGTSIDISEVKIPCIKDGNFKPEEADLLKNGDLIMADASEDYTGIGVTISVHGTVDKKVVGGLHTFALRDQKGLTNEYYRQYIFRNPEIRNQLQKAANGVSVYGLSKTALSKIKLSLPPLPEQNRIVAVLETWDRAIESLTKKVEIKKQVKKGLMQELLTGKTRLKGFNGKWDKTALSSIGGFFKWMGILKDQVTDSGFNAIRYGELYTKYDVKIEKVFSHIPADVIASAQKIQYGDILFAGSWETIDEIGKSASYLIKEDGYAGGDIIIFRPKKADSLFLWYFFNTGEARKKLRELWQGQAVVHLYKSDIEELCFYLPEKDEQIAISNILNSADEEISAIEQKLILLKDQKKYLLNNLITGDIRTPENLTLYS